MSEVWNRNFAGLTLEKSQVKLKTYTGEALDVIGQARVNVSYKDQTAKLPITTVGLAKEALAKIGCMSTLRDNSSAKCS